MKTEEEIKEAVSILLENKKVCARKTFFGDDNHKAIDVMIDVIQHGRSEDYVYDTYPSEDEDGNEDLQAHNLWQSAMSALEFMGGKIPIKDLLYPS